MNDTGIPLGIATAQNLTRWSKLIRRRGHEVHSHGLARRCRRGVSHWVWKAIREEYVERLDLESNRTVYLGCHTAVNCIAVQPLKCNGLLVQATCFWDKGKQCAGFFYRYTGTSLAFEFTLTSIIFTCVIMHYYCSCMMLPAAWLVVSQLPGGLALSRLA